MFLDVCYKNCVQCETYSIEMAYAVGKYLNYVQTAKFHSIYKLMYSVK